MKLFLRELYVGNSQFLNSLIKRLVATLKVGICALVVGYLLLGAFAFQAIEAPAEAQIKYNMSEFRDKIGSVHEKTMTL